MATIVLLARAENDVLRLYAKYESSRPGRGERFSDEVDAHLAMLSRLPRLGRKVGDDYRRLKMSRFDYSLIYTVEGRRVMVHTIASNHASLDEILRSLQS